MPGDMDGLEILRRLRQDTAYRHIPVILLTAKALTVDRIAGFEAGADAYLPKPFAPQELLSVVDAVIERRQQIQQSRGSLAELQDELGSLKALMNRNVAQTVAQTSIYLTPAQREVLDGVCQGWTNREIAKQRGVTLDRIVKTVQALMRLTGTTNRTELMRWAFATGYASPKQSPSLPRKQEEQ